MLGDLPCKASFDGLTDHNGGGGGGGVEGEVLVLVGELSWVWWRWYGC